MLYIAVERTRISRIASSNGQSSDGNRVALVYNAIPIDGRPWKTTAVCKTRIHAHTFNSFVPHVRRKWRSFAHTERCIEIDLLSISR